MTERAPRTNGPLYRSCPRCGIRRSVNQQRFKERGDTLCTDCRSTDPDFLKLLETRRPTT